MEIEKDITADIFSHVPEMEGYDLVLPPKSFTTLEGKIIAYAHKRRITALFPIYDDYCNPTGSVQGGYIAAFFDNTFGPLSYLVALKPVVTLNMYISFLRPLVPPGSVRVEAVLVSRGGVHMSMRAQASDDRNKIVATAESQNLISAGN